MSGIRRSVTDPISYTNNKPERMGQRGGREYFRSDFHADGCRTIAAHGEIDDAPAVVRNANLRVGADLKPQESLDRIAVDGKFRGTGLFIFSNEFAECEVSTAIEGWVSQRIALGTPLAAFGNHAIIKTTYIRATSVSLLLWFFIIPIAIISVLQLA